MTTAISSSYQASPPWFLPSLASKGEADKGRKEGTIFKKVKKVRGRGGIKRLSF